MAVRYGCPEDEMTIALGQEFDVSFRLAKRRLKAVEGYAPADGLWINQNCVWGLRSFLWKSTLSR